MNQDVKKEGTGTRPSVLSEWYRKTLGRQFAIADIDWFITNISNKNHEKRYLIIEEKNIKNDRCLIPAGEFRSLKEFTQFITKFNLPLLFVFINQSMSLGVRVYTFNPEDEKIKEIWTKVGDDWYLDVTSKAKMMSETELADLIKDISS